LPLTFGFGVRALLELVRVVIIDLDV
jgi:hypothetical protein